MSARISYRTQEIARHSKQCPFDTEDNRSVIEPERFMSNGRIRACGDVLGVLWTVADRANRIRCQMCNRSEREAVDGVVGSKLVHF